MTTLSVFRSRLKVKILKKKCHFSCVWQPFHTKSGPFFALPVSVIIVHVDLCCFFSTGQDTTRFPISIARIECIDRSWHWNCQPFLYRLRTGLLPYTTSKLSQCHQCAHNFQAQRSISGVFNFKRTLTSPTHHMLSVASMACSTANERSHPHPTPCSA